MGQRINCERCGAVLNPDGTVMSGYYCKLLDSAGVELYCTPNPKETAAGAIQEAQKMVNTYGTECRFEVLFK